MEIITLPLGALNTNCYIVYDDYKNALIFDPAANSQDIIETVKDYGLTVEGILLTHAHYDHIGALDVIRDTYKVPVYVAEEEQDWLLDPMKNLSGYVGEEITANPAEHSFDIGKDYSISNFQFTVLPTPGHSPGGVSFVFAEDKFVVTGDALFAGSIGRTDFPGSNHSQLLRGIREQLFTLPDNYTIYPGHMGSSTIGQEKITNPFFI